jgi:hypothetical protein
MKVPEVREVFRKIAAGERRHGSFLTTFAQALLYADDENELILQSAALTLIEKYSLQGYAAPNVELAAEYRGDGAVTTGSPIAARERELREINAELETAGSPPIEAENK